MRLVVLALSLPAMFIAMGAAALLAPGCGLAIPMAAAYLALTPVVYYSRRYLTLRPRYFLVSLGMFAALWGLEALLSPILREYEAFTRELLEAIAGCPSWLLYFFITAVVLAPVVEETLFRVILYTELERRAGALVGYVGNSLAFALVHGLPALTPLYFASGLILTYSFKKGGALSSIVLHGLNNLLALLSILP
ncbi:CPBP family intramembrane glutamic endopeptidase [Pyrobaculum neutrophilum]|uniref:Abortive infection protein n=1 Tax=Pyrobaculum neutrophilum (strain DSM 2338 / JCM 9278 / NBRC 100436 / V24Sta) TaxID=444157 RepID=B1YA70_PYRNV|nr:type II CAAX endopeptidase family protein [Pyrobaculum neutrophilum]ACB39044.1 Abortive infection protein [Pyrobaculum neutrophilum V24Sta]